MSFSLPYLILFKRKKYFEITSRKPSSFLVCRSVHEKSSPKQKKIKGNHKPYLRLNHNLHFNFSSTFFFFFQCFIVIQISLIPRSLLYLPSLFPSFHHKFCKRKFERKCIPALLPSNFPFPFFFFSNKRK